MKTGADPRNDQKTGQSPHNVDHIEIGEIKDVTGTASVSGARTNVYQDLTVDQAAALVVELKNKDQPSVWDGRIPYLGLKAYQESDAQFFFGREGLVDGLLERVNHARFITITGPSGSGKSSVAYAGLFHALREGRLQNSESWSLVAMQPNGDPLEQLALAIDHLASKPGTAAIIREEGRQDPMALHSLAEMLLTGDKRQRLLLLVDSFEELFIQTRDEDEREAFINLLTTAAGVDDGRIIVIISLRSDFVANCASYPQLREVLAQEFQLLGAMEPRALARAVILPSLVVGAETEPALVKQIIDDMKGEPGALPLMSFTLRDLFEAQKTIKGRRVHLTLHGYLQRGGIENALERHANNVLESFTDQDQAVARGIFTNLITVGGGHPPTLRSVPLEELLPAGSGRKQVLASVVRLAEEDARLISTSGAEQDQHSSDERIIVATVTVAHEKLIDAWPWLRQLVDENRESIKLQYDISAAARVWQANNRDSDFLYSSARIEAVEEKLASGRVQLAEIDNDFVQASIARQKVAARSRKLVLVGLIALTLLAFAVSLVAIRIAEQAKTNAVTAGAQSTRAHFAEQKSREASTRTFENQVSAEEESIRAFESRELAYEEVTRAYISEKQANENAAAAKYQARLAQSQALALSSDTVGQGDPVLAAQLAIEAERAVRTGLSYDAVQRHAFNVDRPIYTLAHDAAVNGASWNGNGNLILSWSRDSTAKVWAAGSETPRQILAHDNLYDGTEASVLGAIWNFDESLILTWNRDGRARVWETDGGKRRRTLIHGLGITGAAWNGDESLILTWGSDGTAKVWEAGSSLPRETLLHNLAVNGATWNTDESLLLTWSDDGTVKIWEAGSETPRDTLAHGDTAGQNEVWGAAWNGDESLILTWGEDGTAKVWAAGSEAPHYILPHNDPVRGATWNADESLVLTWSDDKSARIWEPGSGSARDIAFVPIYGYTGGQLLRHDGPVNGATWNREESRILTWSEDGTARVWYTFSGVLRHTLPHNSAVNGAAWNRDESLILTWSDDSLARIWQAANGKLIHILPHGGRISGAAWNGDESQILTWSDGQAVKVWKAGSETLNQAVPDDWVVGAAWNEDQSLILTWGGNPHTKHGTVEVWEPGSEMPRQILTHDDVVSGAIWNKDESLILSWSDDGTTRVWQVGNESPRETLVHDDVVSGAVWNEDESLILSWSEDGTAKVWRAGSDTPRRILAHDGALTGAAWNADESLILTWGADGMAKVWGAGILTPRFTLPHGSPVSGAAWNEDGSLITTWSDDGAVKVWPVGSETPRLTLPHDSPVSGVAWNEDGSLIVTWSEDGPARVWDAASGRELTMYIGDGAPITTARRNAAGSEALLTLRDQESVYLLAQSDLLEAACRRLPFNLKWEDWLRFFPNQPYRCTCPDLLPHPSVLVSPEATIDMASCPLIPLAN